MLLAAGAKSSTSEEAQPRSDNAMARTHHPRAKARNRPEIGTKDLAPWLRPELFPPIAESEEDDWPRGKGEPFEKYAGCSVEAHTIF